MPACLRQEIGDEIFDGLGAERARRIIQYAGRTSGTRPRTPETPECLPESCSIRMHRSASAAH